MGFIVTIPSNTSKQYFSDNTQSHFKIYLPKELYFSTQYEVALLEISYPNNFYNFIDQYIKVDYKRSGRKYSIPIDIPDGYYPTDEIMSTHLNDAIDNNTMLHSNIKEKIDFSDRDPRNKTRFYIKENTNEIKITVSEKIAKFLGFEMEDNENSYILDGTVRSNYPSDVFRGLHSMYIYSNIIERQIVGDSLVPLLRVCTINNDDYGNQISCTFNHLRYIPLSLNNIRIIEIDIRNEYGERLPFTSGHVIISLHFRKSL